MKRVQTGMKKSRFLQIMKIILICLSVTGAVSSCGGGGGQVVVITGPGLVGIDDTTASTAPLLTVTYASPTAGSATVNIFSDLASDGDIEFDPVLNTFTVTTSPSEVLFGEDSSNANLPEFRTFLTFPLDGITGQPVVPSDAAILSATLEVFVGQVDFASTIPAFLDLVQYPFRGLSTADFNTPLLTPTSFKSLDFFSSDRGNFVDIDVTALMQEAQVPPALPDFQVRFDLQSLATALSRGPSNEASRSVHAQSRALDKIQSNRGALKPPTQEALKSRRR